MDPDRQMKTPQTGQTIRLSQGFSIKPFSLAALNKTAACAETAFPGKGPWVVKSLIGSCLPPSLLMSLTQRFLGVPVQFLRYFLCVDTDKKLVVGLAGFYAFQNRAEAWAGWFGVRPAYRHYGLGKALWTYACDQVSQAGYDVFRLWTTDRPEANLARAFYLRNGWSLQEAGAYLSSQSDERILLFNKSLKGDQAPLFSGTIEEATLGTDPHEARKGLQRYRAERPLETFCVS